MMTAIFQVLVLSLVCGSYCAFGLYAASRPIYRNGSPVGDESV